MQRHRILPGPFPQGTGYTNTWSKYMEHNAGYRTLRTEYAVVPLPAPPPLQPLRPIASSVFFNLVLTSVWSMVASFTFVDCSLPLLY